MNVSKKNSGRLAGGMATILSCALLFSCNDDDILGNGNPEITCGNICFGISSDKEPLTRGTACGNDGRHTIDRFVLRSDDSTDTLCVRTIVSDGIYTSDFVGEPTLTRSTPVSKDNFYDSFHVLAYWSINATLVDSRFYIDEDAANTTAAVGTGAIWRTANTYYWPGVGHSFQFYAWAPTDAGGLTTPLTPRDKSIAYTVPAKATAQKDIMVAATGEIQGDNNAAVPLTFKHICTAVRFAVGNQMQPGVIKSVSLKGVINTGRYDMTAGTWNLGETTEDFSQGLNKITSGSETNGTEITNAEGTFMMLPQTLPAGAMAEVIFTNASGVDRTLTASIGNTEWAMGTTVTYKLSITPEYELDFSDIPTEVDAHYDIIPLKINANDVKGNWTIATDQPWITIKSALTSYEKDGYWLNAAGDYSAYCTSEGVDIERQQTLDMSWNGETELYLFVSENNSTTDRTAKLTLSTEGTETASVAVVQKCPNWQGDIGWEVIEDDLPLPYGFKWDRKVTFAKEISYIDQTEEWRIKQTFKKQPSGFLEWLGSIFRPETVEYVQVETKNSFPKKTIYVTIDYAQMGQISATSPSDGQDNTWNLYSFVGGTSFEGEQYLTGRGYTIESESGTLEDTKNFAALYAIKLNAFDIHKGGSGNMTTYAIIPEQTDIKWYLPASGQFSIDAGLNGRYWSSTAIDNDNTNAYSWDISTQSTPRMELHKVRAVRSKQ